MERSYPNYPPTDIAEIVEHVPDHAAYIGKIKLVPSDNSNSFNKEKAIKKLKKSACEYGAKYILITHMEASGSDFIHTHLDRSFGDGITIEANLYR